MKIIDALNAFQAIQKLIDDPVPKSAKFNYALIKNRRALDAVVQQYNQALAQEQNDPMFEELLQRWREAATPFAETQENGELVRDVAGNIIIPPDRVIEYNLVCEEILLERQDYRAAFDQRNTALSDLHRTEAALTPYPIALSLFPAETDYQIIDVLYAFIDGDH